MLGSTRPGAFAFAQSLENLLSLMRAERSTKKGSKAAATSVGKCFTLKDADCRPRGDARKSAHMPLQETYKVARIEKLHGVRTAA